MKRLILAASIAAAALGTAHANNFGGYNGQWADYPNLSRYGDGYAFATTRAYSYQNFPEYYAANGMATGSQRSAARTGDPVNPGGSATQRLSETTGPASTMNSPQNGHMIPAPGYDSRGNPTRAGTTDNNATMGGSSAAGTAAGAAAAGSSSMGSGSSSMGSGSSGMGGSTNMGGSSTQRQSETTGPASTMNSPQNGHMTPSPSHSGSGSGLSSGSGAAGTGAGAAGSTGMGGASGTMQQRDMTTTTPGSTLPADPTVRGTPGDRPVTGR